MWFLRGAGLLACAVAFAGCAVGDSGSGENEITREQLAVMVLPRDEFAVPVSGLEVDPEDSGRVTAAEAAEASTDPDDTAADLRRAGWLDGYELNYSDPNRAASFKRGEGLIVAGSTVDLFDTQTSARAHLLQEIGDLERLRGKTVEGVRLAAFDTFDVGVGDEGWGIELTARVGGVSTHVTGVVFRSGRLVADTGFMRADEQPMRDEAVKAAHALESRIGRVLAGQLDADPVPLPVTKPVATAAQLSRMTLAVKDLPQGARVADEGRGRSRGNYVSYYRSFDVNETFIGSSHLMFLRAQTDVFTSTAAARSTLRQISTRKGRALFARVVLRDFKKLAGARARNVQVRALPHAGRDATGIVITFDLPSGRYRIATVIVRSGKSIAVVSGFCTAHAVHPEDLPALGKKARARLASIPV